MELKEIIESTRLYNFHSHTHFCDGQRPMEEMVRAAIDAGLQHYGFTGHSPVPVSPLRRFSPQDAYRHIHP